MSRVSVIIIYRYWIMIHLVLLRNLPICCTPIHCYPVLLSKHVLLLNGPHWLTTYSVTACYMIIRLLLVFYTLTYQTTFCFLSMAHLKQRICLFLKKCTFSEQNIAQFSLKICDRNWYDLLACNDPKIAYTVFSNTITELFNICFPFRTVKHGYKTRKPWLTEGPKKSLRWKNKLYHRKQKSKSEGHGQLYKQCRNKLNKLLLLLNNSIMTIHTKKTKII